jgi:hypothetical protein
MPAPAEAVKRAAARQAARRRLDPVAQAWYIA